MPSPQQTAPVHLRFHGVSAEETAEIVQRQQRG
jgi:hypothetical protein